MRRTENTIWSKVAGLLRSVGILLLLLVGTMAVWSCGGSDDSTPSVPSAPPSVTPQPRADTPIGFYGILSKEEGVTRAGTQSPLQEYPDASHGHTSFNAWSYKDVANTIETVMYSYVVNYIAGSSGSSVTNSRGWEYVGQQGGVVEQQSVKYWDFQASSYRFFGYTGTGVTASYSPSSSAPTSVTFEVDIDDVTASVDANTPLCSKLWYKSVSDLGTVIQPVTLEFVRPIARVRFMFTFIDGLGYGRENLYDVKFRPTDSQKNIAKGGTVSFTYPLTGSATESWDSSPSAFYTGNNDLAIDYYETPSPPVSPTDARPETYPNTPEHWYEVLPRSGADQGSYTLSVVVGGGDPRICVVPAEYMTWSPGFEYTYLFKITEGGGVSLDNVQVAINTWNPMAAVVHPVYNW